MVASVPEVHHAHQFAMDGKPIRTLFFGHLGFDGGLVRAILCLFFNLRGGNSFFISGWEWPIIIGPQRADVIDVTGDRLHRKDTRLGTV